MPTKKRYEKRTGTKKPQIAKLTTEQIQKLKEYEKEMDVILIAYKKSKEE